MFSYVVVLSKSEESTPLTIVNTILKDVKFHKQYSQFNVNGSHIIVITPSVPIYITDESLYNVYDCYHIINSLHKTIFTKLLLVLT